MLNILEGQISNVEYRGSPVTEDEESIYSFVGTDIVAVNKSRWKMSSIVQGAVVQLLGGFDDRNTFRVKSYLNVWNKELGAISDFVNTEGYKPIGGLDEARIEEIKPVISNLKDVELALIQELASNPKLMHELNPEVFEKLVAELMAGKGWDVEWTGRTKNTGVDVIAIRTDELGINSRFLVECKRYNKFNKVGVELVRTLYGSVMSEKANGGIMVTTSKYQSGALKFASDTQILHTKDYDDLCDWVRSYQPNKDGMLYVPK